MILDLVLHEGNAFALHRAGEDRGGPPLRAVGFLDRREDLAEVVPVDRQDVPVERLPLLRKRLEGHDVLRARSEEHTSELQSRLHLVCRLLLEKKKHKVQYRLLFFSHAEVIKPSNPGSITTDELQALS